MAKDFISDDEMNKIAPDFIPDEKPADSNALEAFISQWGNMGTLGYLPQINAGIQSLFPGQDQSYTQLRDAEIKRMEALKKGSPIASTLGGIGGAIATAPLAGMGAVKALPAIAKVGSLGKAALAGATQGAVFNPGDKEGEISPLQLGERATQAGLGALTGGITQGALGLAGKAVSTGGKKIKEFAEERATGALGMFKHQAKQLIQNDPMGLEGKNIRDIGRFALDNKIVTAGDTIESIALKSAAKRNEIGQQIGELYNTANDALSDVKVLNKLPKETKENLIKTVFNPKMIAKEFFDNFKETAKGTATGNEDIRAVKNVLENFKAKGNKPVGIKDLQEFKSQLDDLIYGMDKSYKVSGVVSPGKEGLKKFRDEIKSKIDARVAAIDSAGLGDIGSKLKKLNQDYGKATAATKIARDRLSSDLGNNFLSITDKGLGGAGIIAGAATGGIPAAIGGAALGLASKGARTYGRPIMATSADKLADLINAISKTKGASVIKKASEAPLTTGVLSERLRRLKALEE